MSWGKFKMVPAKRECVERCDVSKFTTIDAFLVNVNKSSVPAIFPEQSEAAAPFSTPFVTVAEIHKVVTLMHSVSKVQQRQLDVAAILHRFLHEVLHRPNGSLNLPIALGVSRTARDMLEVPFLRELSELAARELLTIVRHHYFRHSMTRKL